MNKCSRILLLMVVMIFLLPFQILAGTGKVKVIILHANDMHSKIDNMGKLAYLADSLHRGNPYVFLVSAGDNFTGNPVVDMVPDKGYPMIDLMNRCGFVVSAIGNHEFDMGQQFLSRRMTQAVFPFISCNIDSISSLIKKPKPYIVLDAGKDAKIAILSAIELNQDSIPDTNPANLKGLRFSNGLTKMREYKWLKKEYGILVGLTHLGIDDDKRLADSMPELDVILGGHSHTLLEKPVMENGVMIGQAGAHLKYIGKTTLTIEDGKVTGREYEIIPMASLTKEYWVFRDLIDKYNKNETFARVVGVAEAPLEGNDELGSLMADAVTSRLNLDIALQNKGGIRLYSLPQGDITLKSVYQLDPFGNDVILFRMTPAEIRTLITYGTNLEKGIDFQVSGMTYKVTVDAAGKCTNVELSDMSGKPLDPARTFNVGLSAYVAAVYKFTHSDPGKSLFKTTAEALIEYLGEMKKVNYSGVRRAVIVR